MIIRTVIFGFNLLNLFLFFRLFLGCEFRRTRLSVIIGILIVAGLYALFMPWMDAYLMELPDISAALYALLPVIWLKGRRANLFLAGISFFYATAPLDNLICGIMMVVQKGKTDFADFNYCVIASQLVTAVVFAGLIYCTRNYRRTIGEIANNISIFLFIFFIVVMHVFQFDYKYIGGNDLDIQILSQGANAIKDSVTSIIFTVLMVALISIFYQRKRLNREMVLNKRCIEEQAEQYEFMGKANQETRKFRHDFNKHMDMLADLYDHGHIDELGAYIHQLGTMKERAYYLSTGNMVCDAIVNRYYAKCRDEGIILRCSGTFHDDLSIEMSDLCVIMSNALENAYEASCQCDENREIQCKIGNEKSLIFITIINPVQIPPAIEGGFINSTKDDAQAHGFGTKIMQETAARNGGSVKWKYDAQTKKIVTKICLMGQKCK